MSDPSAIPHHQSAMDETVEAFTHPRYLVRRKVLKFAGGAFHIFDDAGNVVLYSKMKAFKLKEDIRLYTDESMATELLRISTQSVFDISGTYDVVDAVTNDRVGALRRKGMKSIFKDEWLILDPAGDEVGKIAEDSAWKATLRRFIDFASILLPQRYSVTMGGVEVAEFKQNFNPFVYKLEVDFERDGQGLLDRRLGIAAAVLLAAIEGKQD